MSLSRNSPYLDENAVKIRAKSVPWEGHQRAGRITSDELNMIKKVDRQPKAKAENILLSEGAAYAKLYLQLLKKLNGVDTMQSILILIGDAITDHPERVSLFLNARETDPDLPYVPLIKALDSIDDFIQLKASQVLTILLNSESSPLPTETLHPLLSFLATTVQGSVPYKRDVGVQCLESLLERPECRNAVWGIPGIIGGFVDILKQDVSPQLNYQVIYSIWLLTFETAIAENIDKQFDIIPILVKTSQASVKEKVIRVVVASFRNLVAKAPAANLPHMLVVKLLPYIKNLSTRKWSDEDILEDVQYLRDELTANFESLTTHDEYTSELMSGHLSWTPVHESDDFWKEHAAKLNDRDNEQLKALVSLLNTSRDPVVLAVALHDIGMYVKYCDTGKKFVTSLGAKTRAMELMSHSDPDVQYRALVTVQRLVSQPWMK